MSIRASGRPVSSDDAMAMVFTSGGNEMGGNRLSLGTFFHRAVASYRFVPGEHVENTLRLSVGRDRFDEVAGKFLERLYMDSLQLRDTARLRAWRRR